ncbi:hypothetical protein AGRO_1618 [Agrobacterium sp. ATCC 31749]|nr:hypothetical protein AGRO_1618 [Agrobacterium sp. ATCC 31749]
MDSASQLSPTKENDHTYHMLSARVTRRESSGEVLDFKVFCNRIEDTESGEVETNVASLKGFVHYSLEMPGMRTLMYTMRGASTACKPTASCASGGR